MSSEPIDRPRASPVDYDPFAGPALARIVPTTEPQREVWLASRLGREAALAYSESVSLEFLGPLNIDALRDALQALVQRHDSLRSTFSANGERLCISESIALDVALTDHSSLSGPQREDSTAAAKKRAVETPFDLERGPLFRAEILRFGADDHLLIVTAHHIICDGWSFGIIVRDLAAAYAQRIGIRGREIRPPASFGDYALAQSAAAESARAATDETYWISRLAGSIPVLDLPTDRARPARRTFRSRREDHVLDAGLVSDLRNVGARNGASLFATLLAGFTALICRLSSADDVVIGVPSAGQSSDGTDMLVGHCVNLLPLRLAVDATIPMNAMIAATQDALLDAREHAGCTYGTVLRKLAIERDPSRPPLVGVMFNLDQVLNADAAGFPELRVQFSSNPRSYENFELFVNAVQVQSAIRLECQYNTDLFDAATIRRWLKCYASLLRAACVAVDAPIGELNLLGEDDWGLLTAWNQTARTFSRGALVHELFEAQAHRVPGRIAIRWQGAGLTYDALEARANRLAHCLKKRGARRGALVGLHVERGPDMIAAALAVLKTGAAYVPLDPSYPTDRLSFMAADAGLSVVITESALPSLLDWPRERMLVIDADGDEIASQAGTPVRRNGDSAEPEDPAYVIYTSGSTGNPKGVRVPHRAIVNFLESMAREPGLTEDDRMVAVTTLSFDIAVNEIFLPLSVGAEIVLAARQVAADGGLLAGLIEDSRATVLQATPATWRLLVDAGWRGGRHFKALCGGEALSADLAQQLIERTGSLWNLYGPTEATVWSTCMRVTGIEAGISIGRPIANTSIWILDGQQKPCPVGVPGEIWIGGDGVALGYLNRPALTAERFIADPFSRAAGARIYRTGDRGRWRATGVIEHLGRLDFQVKVRGYRIEPGEIESNLARHPDVARALVIAREDRPGDVRLVAYVVARPGSPPNASALRDHLGSSLPDYMVPQHIVPLPAIPVLPNGKIDRKALPAPVTPATSAVSYVAPRTDLERGIAAAMEASLGMRGISVHDDFFALGGHSLLAAQLTSRLNQQFKTNLSVHALFEAPTVARLATAVQAETASMVRRTPIERRANQDRAPMSQMQERLWLLEEVNPRRVVYNTPAAHRLHGTIDEGAFERAFREMVRRQAVLRTRFEREGASAVQRVLDDVAIPPLFPAEDLSAFEPQEREARLRKRVDALCAETFDLGEAPLFRVHMFRLGENEHVLFFMAHHIVWDGWSFDLFYDEMSALYGAFSQARPSPLPEPAVSYGDFSVWHREWLKSPEFEKQLAFWRTRLGRAGKFLPLPADKPRRSGMTGVGDAEVLRVDGPKVEALHELARQTGTTLYANMLAAYCVLLHDYSRQTNLVIGTPVRGRNRAELEAIMGYFNNLLPLQIEVDPGETFNALVRRVRDAAVEILAHPDVPLEMLASELSAARSNGGAGLYQALFSFQDARQRNRQWGQLRHERYPVFQRAATEDLGMWFVETPEGLYGGMTFHSEILARATVQRLRDRYFEILDAVIAAPETTVAALAGPDGYNRAGSGSAAAGPDIGTTNDMNRESNYVAPRNDLEISLATVWERVLGVERVGINDNFFDLGGNSIGVLRLTLEMQKATGIPVGLGDVFRNPTISQLVASFGPEKRGSAAVVVPLQVHGDGVAVFCICGINIYRDFAKSLGTGQPVYGVFVEEEQAIVSQMVKGERPTVSIDRLVQAYDDAIARFRPAGPYRLAGLSFGGILAIELASRMRQRGAEVEIVFLIDSVLPEATHFNWVKWISYQMVDVAKGNVTRKLGKLLDKVRSRFAAHVPQRDAAAPADHVDKGLAIGRGPAFAKAAQQWQERKIASGFRVILFRASDRSMWGPYRDLDDDYGWRRHLGDRLEIVDVSGHHRSIIEPPNVAALGRKAQEFLAAKPEQGPGSRALQQGTAAQLSGT